MWLLTQSVFDSMQRAALAGMHPTAEQRLEMGARAYGSGGDGPRLLTVAGSTAEIAISGVITKAPDFLAMLFGGGNTTYADITSALAAAEQDDSISETVLAIDSPGGQVDGLFDTLAAIQAAKKPIKAVVSNQAASAAYAIAAQADEIVAGNRAASFGSIGIAASFRVDDSVIDITSTEAPDKRPDVSTAEGKAVYVKQLDALHELFAESIAGGRNTTIENVNANFGRGATLLADEALKRGMIDGIASSSLKVVKKTPAAASGANSKEVKAMDLAKLKSEHPDVYAAAVQVGMDQAIVAERDRVGAFLVAGEQSGDMKTALDAIKEGSQMTATLSTQFLMAARNRADVDSKQVDSDAAATALAGAQGSDEEKDVTASKALTSAVFAACGVKEVA